MVVPVLGFGKGMNRMGLHNCTTSVDEVENGKLSLWQRKKRLTR